MAARTGTRRSGTQDWRHSKLTPVVLLYGSDEYFVRRVRQLMIEQYSAQYQEYETEHLQAKDYRSGELALATSPSLFSAAKVIEISSLSTMNEEFVQDILHYLESPEPDVLLLLHHSGGNRGKKVLDQIRASSLAQIIECKPLKTDKERSDFVLHEMRAAGKKIDPAAVQLLVAAVGQDTAELASACTQLIGDGPNLISTEIIDSYYGGRVEVTAFKVSDVTVAGNTRLALQMMRQALDSGVAPIPLLASLALRIRNIALVHGVRGASQELAGDLKMAPWQVEQALRDSRRFSAQDLQLIIRVLADSDAQLKGENVDQYYPVEKAVLTISRAAR